MPDPLSWCFVYADERELDIAVIQSERSELIRLGRLKMLKTGVGKARAAMTTSAYLTHRLRNLQPKPLVVSIGTCASLDPGLDLPPDRIVRPRRAVDRDATPQALLDVHLQPQPDMWLEDYDDLELTIGTGDGFLADEGQAARLLESGVQLADMETHAVAYAAHHNLAGPALSVRYVSDTADGEAGKDWQRSLVEARRSLTAYVLTLTK